MGVVLSEDLTDLFPDCAVLRRQTDRQCRMDWAFPPPPSIIVKATSQNSEMSEEKKNTLWI